VYVIIMGMDIYGLMPSDEVGEYFRANIWSWPIIAGLCDEAGFGNIHWCFNDGAGLSTQVECDSLADALAAKLEQMPEKLFVETNCWTDGNGALLSADSAKEASQDEIAVEPACSATREMVADFVKFLRKCGGFAIW